MYSYTKHPIVYLPIIMLIFAYVHSNTHKKITRPPQPKLTYLETEQMGFLQISHVFKNSSPISNSDMIRMMINILLKHLIVVM